MPSEPAPQAPSSLATLRGAGAADLEVLRTLYTELLHVLYRANPTVDTTHVLQADWVEKPGKLHTWMIERGPGAPAPESGHRSGPGSNVEGARGSAVGFALVCGKEYAHALGSKTDFLLYEYLITERARRSGIGRAALAQIFDQHPGTWSLDVLPGNQPAMGFWSSVLTPYAPTQVERVDDEGVTFIRFEFDTAARPQ